MALAAGCSVVVAVLSLAVVRPAPSYDPWAWLLWGRELAAGRLSTVDGPAIKPLAMAVCTLLAPLGAAAPVLWVGLVRAGAVVGVWLGFRLGRRLAAGSAAAGVLAAAGVALCGGYLELASSGASEGLLLALALAGGEAWRHGRHRPALACAVACALVRVETWPFLGLAAVRAWRRRPDLRPLLALAAIAVPAGWFLLELAGSGVVLRSAIRARVPNAGQPALADVPALASLAAAAGLVLWPLWGGVAVLASRGIVGRDQAARAALAPAAVGGAWMAVVAVMAQAGFSGEPRYALPGAALVSVTGAAGLALAARSVPAERHASVVALVVVAVAVAVAPRAAALPRVRAMQEHQWALQADLAGAVGAAGGRAAVLACGQPYVGPLRGPLLAYRLGVPKHVVEPDRAPRGPGMVFRSRLTAAAPRAPALAPGFAFVARVGTWEVHRRC